MVRVRQQMRNVFLAIALVQCSAVYADDLAGWMRVQVPSNELTAVALPFVPFGSGGFCDFLSGPFVEADEISRVKDILTIRLADSASFDAFVYGRAPTNRLFESMLDPGLNLVTLGYPSLSFSTSSLPAEVSVAPDWAPDCPSGLLPWQVPVALTNAASRSVVWSRACSYPMGETSEPRFAWMSVDPLGAFAELGVDGFGRASDVLRLVSSEGLVAGSSWEFCTRLRPSSLPQVWRDAIAGRPASASFYLASDATCDTDGDGIPDAVETYVHGTSPIRADTDGDGIDDAFEVVCGRDPLHADAPQGLIFSEPFERPAVVPGELNGQNGWVATCTNVVLAQTDFVQEGAGALKMHPDFATNLPPVAVHAITGAPQVVWLDMYLMSEDWGMPSAGPSEVITFGFDYDGHPVTTDGDAVVTNVSVVAEVEKWTRCTAMLDCVTRRWDFYVDGVIVGRNLMMRGSVTAVSELAVVGANGCVDGMTVSGIRPKGLSSDGDPLPDEWELVQFGTLDRDGSGDADSDGLSDAGEWRAGSDPFEPDTDHDGLPDAWEVECGLDPSDPRDAFADPDGDGLPNVDEYHLGTNARAFEPDPRRVRPGLRSLYFSLSSAPSMLPSLDGFDPVAVAVSGPVDFPAVQWPDCVAASPDAFASRTEGFLLVPVTGDWRFRVTSDAGARLSVDGAVVVDDSNAHAIRAREASVLLSAGYHPVRLDYYETTGAERLMLEWKGPESSSWELVPRSVLFHHPENLPPKVAFAVPAGEYVEDDELVLVASAEDIDGTVASMRFFDNGVEIGAFGGPVATNNIVLSGGVHAFSVVATDDLLGATTASVSVAVHSVPQGYAHGLDAAFYAFTNSLDALPDVAELVPVSTSVWTEVAVPKTTAAWRGAPSNLVDRFSVALDGALLVPRTCHASIRLTSANGSRLFLDGRIVLDHDGRHAQSSKSASLPVSEGFHDLRVECFNDTGAASLTFAWALGGATYETVPAHWFFRRVGVVDSDGDGLPDWWETENGLDPWDSSDAEYDLDGDGFTNLAEFRNRTNPRLADTDGDGVPDAWEVARGTKAFLADELEDPDGDGLVNADEFVLGARPDLVDTDGDGVSDGDEAHVYFSDPSLVDFNGLVVTNAVIPHAAVDCACGLWYVDDDEVRIGGRAGTVFYTNDFEMAAAGIREIRTDCRFMGKYRTELVCRVDGEVVGSHLLQATSVPHAEHVRYLTPWLGEGCHELSLELQNFANGVEFSFGDIALCTPVGPDADGNGTFDWIDSRRRFSRTDCGACVRSRVSPFCLRGKASNFRAVGVVGGSSACPLPRHGWCSEVELLPEEAVSVTITYEHGMKSEACNVEWIPFDVMSEHDIVLRAGDSLRLTAGCPSASDSTVFVNGVLAAKGKDEVYRFERPGVFDVEGRAEGMTNIVRVEVVSVEMPSVMPVRKGKVNTLRANCSDMANLLASFDAGSGMTSITTNGSECAVSLSVEDFGRPTCFAFEIPNPDASVAKVVELRPFALHYTLDGAYYEAHRFEDGSVLVENRISAFEVPPEAELRMTSSSGIAYADGAVRMDFGADDFDATGDFIYQFIVPPELAHPCQFLRLLHDGKAVSQ